MFSVVNTLETFGCTSDLPSVESIVSRIHICREEKDLLNARSLHLQICNFGLESNTTLGNYVVPMFVDCGSMLESQNLFKKLACHTEHSWTSLIQGFHEGGNWECGFNLYQEMLHQGVNPSPFTFTILLKACAKLNWVERGQECHSELTKKGFETTMSVGNILVDMYAKCGLLMDSQDTFNDLSFRDSFSWTALASGYAELGFAQQAIACFEKMQGEGIPHTTVSYLCNVKVCGILGDLDKGYLVHMEIAVNGFESMTFVSSALVGMYVKFGLLAQARDVFDEMSGRDAVSWNVLFMGYAEHGLDNSIIECWEEMNSERVSPDAAAYVTMIRTCGSIGDVGRGHMIHAECLCKGYESDPYVISMLIDMYMKFAHFSEAQQVFDQSPTQDVVLWTGLIAGYAEHELCEQALGCFRGMSCHDILPNSITFACTLKACCSGRSKNEGKEVHSQAVKLGYESDSLVSGSLIDLYVRLGLFADAAELFDRTLSQDIVSWNILIAGYVEHADFEEGLKCFQRMQQEGIPATTLTFVSSLKACGSMGDIEAGQDIHISIIKQGLERDMLVGNILVDMYARCNSLAEAADTFKRLDSRDVISWTALIQGYVDKDMGIKAIDCFELMQEENICPDIVTCACILQACGDIGARERGQLMHMDSVIRGIEGDFLAGNALVDMYAKLGLFAESWAVFRMVLDPDLGMWNTLIQGYAEHGLAEEAMALLEEMQRDGLSPDVFTWNVVMAAYVEHDDVDRVFKIYVRMQEQGTLPNDFTFMSVLASCGNTSALRYGRRIHAQIARENLSESLAVSLIDMYGNCGSMVDSQQAFDVMPIRDTVAWNALIAGYTRQGNTKLVFCLYDSMIENGFTPNEITCLSLLSACQHAGLVETGRDCFEDMSTELGIEPTMKHYACTVDLLGRAGQLYEIVTFMQEMPFQPNLVTWHTFIGACQRYGNVDLGKRAFEFATSLSEKHAGAYVFMSNIYVDVDSEEPHEAPAVEACA